MPAYNCLLPIDNQLPFVVIYTAKLYILGFAVPQFGKLVDILLALMCVQLLVNISIVGGFHRGNGFLHLVSGMPIDRRLAIEKVMMVPLFLLHFCLDIISPEPGVLVISAPAKSLSHQAVHV